MHSRSMQERPETTGRTISWAGHYDLVVRLMTLGRDRRLRQETIALAGIRPGERVLEVGCGTGEVMLAARRATGASGKVCGIDASPEMVAVAREKARRQGLELDLRVEPIERLSHADGSFDVVLSSLMMHHLPDEVKQRGLAEIWRVLRPGGRLLIVDFRRPTTRLAKLGLGLMLHHTMRRSVEDLVPLVEQAGLTGVETGALRMRSVGYVRAWKSSEVLAPGS